MKTVHVFQRVFLAWLFFMPVTAFSQHADVGGLNQAASRLINEGRPVEAEALARQAVTVAESLSSGGFRNLRGQYLPEAQSRLGTALRLQGRFAEAESILRESLSGADQHHGYSSRLAIKTHLNLGASVQALGRYSEADRIFRDALARVPPIKGVGELEMWMDAQVRLGRLQIQAGNYVEAERLLQTALQRSEDIDRKLDAKKRQLEQEIAAELSGYQQRQSKGTANVNDAERIDAHIRGKRSNISHEQYVMRWRTLALVGMSNLRGLENRLEEAEDYARQAADLAAFSWGESHSNTMNATINLARILLQRDKAAEAETWSLRGVRIADTRGGELIGTDSKAYQTHAEVLDAKGERQAAEAMYRRALDLTTSQTPAEIALKTLHSSAGFFSRRDKMETAMPLYDQAVTLADRLFALSRGLDENAREAKLQRLRPIYGEAVSNRVKLDMAVPGKGHDRFALADVSRTQSRLFTEMLRTANVARMAGDGDFVKLKSRRDELIAHLDELQRRFDLSTRFNPSNEQIEPARPIDDPFILERWERDAMQQLRVLTTTRRERDAVEAELWRQYPRYMELEEPRPVTVDLLQRNLLRADERLLVYFRLQNQLLIFLVGQHEFKLVRVPVSREELDDLVAQVRRPMESGGRLDALTALDPAALHRLYDVLIKPVSASLPENSRLTIVGDGPLYTLPLEMLVTRWNPADQTRFNQSRKPDLSEFGQLDFAGAHWRFSYAPSLAALAIQRTPKPAKAHRQNLIAFADPLFESEAGGPTGATRAILAELGALRGNRISIPRLPETADEVLAVAAILGGDNRMHLRNAAQEARAKRDDLSGSRYLHFATHGLLGGEFARLKDYAGNAASGATRNLMMEDSPEIADKPVLKGQPALVMTLVGDLEGEDGLLTMSEVMGLKLNADLVVLSACNTAGERTEARNGEGFAGLTRAFMHAGARGLLVSHWSVESAATRDLITDFFRRQKAGAATPEALASAQAAIRASRDANLQLSRAHPFFWAPFVHVGE
jgi:CHAT domain-containing protein